MPLVGLNKNEKLSIVKCEAKRETYCKMHLFFKEQKFCDIVLVAGKDNTKIAAHRIILAAASEYFLGFLESYETEEHTVQDVSGEILNLILNFVYTATIKIDNTTVNEIMHTANYLKLETLVKECSDFLSGSLDRSNCLLTAIYCKENDYEDLFETALMYAAEHFLELIEDETFLKLDLELLCELLKRDDLTVQSEENVFRGIMSWVEHDKTNRERNCIELLSYLRFPLLTPNFIVNEIGDVLQAPEYMSIVMKALKYHMSPTPQGTLFPEELCRPRNKKTGMILIKGGLEVGTPLIAEVYDPLTCAWNSEEWPSNSEIGWLTNGILFNEKVYLACTKMTNTTETSRIYCFDLTTKEWSELPPMIEQRFSFGMVELNGKLYVIGGTNGISNLCTVEKWDPNSPEEWQAVAPMEYKRCQPGAAVCNGLLYVIGSTDDFEHNTFEFYDPQTNTWGMLTPPVEARTSVGLCVIKGLMYAVGGRSEGGLCAMVERYDLKCDEWTEISPSGNFHQYLQCAAYMKCLMVLVEANSEDVKHVLEEYNPETGNWRKLHSLPRDHGTVILVTK